MRFLNMPLERDEGEYAYAGQLILQGVPPYEFAYNMKLPGTYTAYALIMALFGQTAAGIHLGLLLLNALTIVLIFFLARKFFAGGPSLVACVTFAFLSLSPSLLGMAAHATHFVVLFAVAGILLLQKNEGTRKPRLDFAGGLLLGLAFLMKQPGIFFVLFGAFWILRREWQLDGKTFFPRALLFFTAGAALPFLVTCSVLMACGVFSRFWFWTFTYARIYGSETSLIEGWMALEQFLGEFLEADRWLWLFAGAGLFLLPWERNSARAIFLLALLVASFLATAVGLYFREHYWVMMLPLFSLLAAFVVELLGGTIFKLKWQRWLVVALWCWAAAWSILGFRDALFGWTPQRLSDALYSGNPFSEAVLAADYIQKHSKPTDRIAVIGSEPEIYFYANRRSATGYIYMYPLMEPQPFAAQMQEEMIKEIKTSQPEFCVMVDFDFSWLKNPESKTTILDWSRDFFSNYTPIAFFERFPDGRQSVVIDDEAADYHPQSNQRLSIWKRKPAP